MKKYIIFFLMVSLAGCVPNATIKPTSSNENSYTGPVAVLTGDSLIAPRFQIPKEGQPTEIETKALGVGAVIAPLALALAPKALEMGVQLGADYLKERATEYTASNSARTSELFYNKTLKPKFGCLIFTYGSFGTEDQINQMEETQGEKVWTKDNLKKWHDKLSMIRPPKIYAEFSIEYAEQANGTYTAFRLVPYFLDYRETTAKRTRKENTKHLLFTFDFSGLAHLKDDPEKGTFKTRFAKESIELKSVKIGTRVYYDSLKHLMTGFWPLPQLKIKEEKAVVRKGGLFPFSVLVTLQEVEKDDDLLLKASEVLEEKKTDLSKALEGALKKALEEYLPKDKK